MTLILLTTEFDKKTNKISLKFYDTSDRQIYIYYDQTNFLPYCLSSIQPDVFYTFCRKQAEFFQHSQTSRQPKKKVEEIPEDIEEIDDIDPVEKDEESEDIEEGEDSEIEKDEESEGSIVKTNDISNQEEKDNNDLTSNELDEIINEAEKEIKKNTNEFEFLEFQSLPIEPITKFNPITHRNEVFTKIYGKTPLDISNQYDNAGVNICKYLTIEDEKKISYAWENTIQHRYNYMFENGLIFGMPYEIKMKEVILREPKPCPECKTTRGLFSYFILNNNPKEISNLLNGVILGKIICENCGNLIFKDERIKEGNSNYSIYYTVSRDFDLQLIKKMRPFPVLVETKIDPNIIQQIEEKFMGESKEEKELMRQWLPLFFTNIPTDLYRGAMDIEVYVPKQTVFPSVTEAKYPISAVNFTDTDGNTTSYLLKIWKIDGDKFKDIPNNHKTVEFDQNHEKDLILAVLTHMVTYPLLITFNGDSFDLPYIYSRAIKLGISKELLPYSVKPKKSAIMQNAFECTFKTGLHFDLYSFFSSRSLKAYAFKNKYNKVSLKEVTKALLPKGHTKVDDELRNSDGSKKEMKDYTKNELLYYNYNDSKITLELTTYDDFIVMRILFILMRLSKTGLEDFVNHQISYWLKNLIFYEHRQRNWLIPQESQIRAITNADTSSNTNKQFQGAIVLDTIAGIHFDVKVMDFSSLYPSIIKTRNLSYETVDCCKHPECKKNKVPETRHWVCDQNQGIIALLIGTIRDYRVLWFKATEEENDKLIKKLKEQNKDQEAMALKSVNKFYNVTQSSLKVFINAGYGVFASLAFHFFQIGMAESVTAIGRSCIKQVIDKTKEMNIVVVGGDTDSVFMKGITDEQQEFFEKWSLEELKIPLDADSHYRFLAISERKKNYVGFYMQTKGITSDSPFWKKPILKGVKGKKVNTPQFIKDIFEKVIHHLDINITKIEDLPEAKKYMIEQLKGLVISIVNGKLEFKQLIYVQQVSKDVCDYGSFKESNRQLLRKAREGRFDETDTSNTGTLVFSVDKNQSADDKEQEDIEEDQDVKIEKMIIKAYKQFQTKGIPQGARCALTLLQHGEKVEKGDYIKFIKTQKAYGGGAMPYTMVTDWSMVNKSKYLEEVKSTFSQLYDCFTLDANKIMDNARSNATNKSLDDLFKSPKNKGDISNVLSPSLLIPPSIPKELPKKKSGLDKLM